MERMSVAEAAEVLGISTESLRYWMEQGKLKIGKVIKGRKRNTYLIFREMVNKEIGRT